jgi:hypothetical protein
MHCLDGMGMKASQQHITLIIHEWRSNSRADVPTDSGEHITAVIAKGSIGNVNDAIQLRFVARWPSGVAAGPIVDRFVAEAKSHAQLLHPRIPSVHELGNWS